jgi:hypothetical protein
VQMSFSSNCIRSTMSGLGGFRSSWVNFFLIGVFDGRFDRFNL